MQTQIKSYKINTTIHGHYFFVLSKGLNAGKPLEHPCANCFVVMTSTQRHKELLYWMCFAFWQSKAFEPYLVGSVILFLRIHDLKAMMERARMLLLLKPKSCLYVMTLLKKLNLVQKRLQAHMDLIDQAKRTFILQLYSPTNLQR